MELYGKEDKSTAQKIILVALEIVIIYGSYWLLFSGGYSKLFSTAAAGNEQRHWVLFLFNLIVFIRLCVTFFYLTKRHMPWAEAFSIPFAFATYYIGFALLGYKSPQVIDGIDLAGIFLFAAGSFLNTGSELLRNKWKKDPENKGKLYTKGLFRYSRHINYFGDILWVTGYAVVCRNWYAAIIPVSIFCFFAFYNAPKLDKYLATKYGGQFDDYRKKTKMLVPFIY